MNMFRTISLLARRNQINFKYSNENFSLCGEYQHSGTPLPPSTRRVTLTFIFLFEGILPFLTIKSLKKIESPSTVTKTKWSDLADFIFSICYHDCRVRVTCSYFPRLNQPKASKFQQSVSYRGGKVEHQFIQLVWRVLRPV